MWQQIYIYFGCGKSCTLLYFTQVKHQLSLSVFTSNGLYVAVLCVLVPIKTTSVPASLNQQAATYCSADKLALGIHIAWVTAEVWFVLYRTTWCTETSQHSKTS